MKLSIAILLICLPVVADAAGLSEEICRAAVDRYESYAHYRWGSGGQSRKSNVSVRPQTSRRYQVNFVGCNVGGDYFLEVAGSGEILSFKALKVIGALFPNTSEMSVTQDVPRWTEVRAVAEAQEFASRVLGKWPKETGTPEAKFESSQVYGKRFAPGTWTVRWPRIDGRGYLFSMDGIHVILSEKVGGIFVASDFTSTVRTSEGAPKPRAEALVLATAYARKAASKVPRKSFELELQPATESLWIQRLDEIEVSAKKDGLRESRLVWTFSFQFAEAEPGRSDGITVFVDAIEGNYLGFSSD